jgi:hypothetical protein
MRMVDLMRGPWWMRSLDWIEAHTPGGRWPWGQIWLWHGFAFHFASGNGGFALTIPLPRWLPGFVRPYQVDELRTRSGRSESNLHLLIPLFPLGRLSAMRTRRSRR